jgi:hypothetical protein
LDPTTTMASKQHLISKVSMQKKDLFRRVPHEIIEYIFQQMSAKDILSCAAVSRQ